MKALIDADILRYEVGFAAETGWRSVTETPDAIPPFDYVREMLDQRIAHILDRTDSTSYSLFLTEGRGFRFDIAKTKPYKGTRPDKKPWHYKNLTVHLRDIKGATVVTNIEADDALTMAHLDDGEGDTVLCSRDKDLRMVPGWFFSWELGYQPEFGPYKITPTGHLTLDKTRSTPKLTGSGTAWFCAQLLMGDSVDNIPGLPKCGPVAAHDILAPVLKDIGPQDEDVGDEVRQELLDKVRDAYWNSPNLPDDIVDADEYLLEQGRLLWMVRRFDQEGFPELWNIGQYE